MLRYVYYANAHATANKTQAGNNAENKIPLDLSLIFQLATAKSKSTRLAEKIGLCTHNFKFWFGFLVKNFTILFAMFITWIGELSG